MRISGILASLCLLGGAFALPLGAEEITVTVPPDDAPPVQLAPAQQTQAPAATPVSVQQPPAAPALPSFASGSTLKAPAASPITTGSTTTDASPAPVKKHKIKQATATAQNAAAGATATDAAPAGAAAAPVAATAAKPAAKAKQASKKSPCFNVDQNTCGGLKECVWVAEAKDDAGKTQKARCRSLAILKKESQKLAKSAKGEVLPWTAKSGGAPASATGSTATAAPAGADGSTTPAKPKKTKMAAAKKKPKDVSPPVPAASDNSAAAAPAEATPAAPGPDPQ